MRQTQHLKQRMAQRGISRRMVDLVLTYGTLEQDKYVLNQRDVQRVVADMQDALRDLKKILDKGGVTVVATDNSLITTYNCTRNH